jgi:hypothetical protein
MEYELSEEAIFYNMATIFVNFFRSVIGWVALELVLYRGRILIGNPDERNQP